MYITCEGILYLNPGGAHFSSYEGMFIANVVCFALWSWSSGATVIIHISVAQVCDRKRKPI